MESLFDGNIWLILILLALCPNLEDKAVTFTRTVEDEAVVKIDKAAR